MKTPCCAAGIWNLPSMHVWHEHLAKQLLPTSSSAQYLKTTTLTLRVCLLNTVYKWIHSICPFCEWLFHSAKCSCSCYLSQNPLLSLRLHNILFQVITYSSSRHLPVANRLASESWLLQICVQSRSIFTSCFKVDNSVIFALGMRPLSQKKKKNWTRTQKFPLFKSGNQDFQRWKS